MNSQYLGTNFNSIAEPAFHLVPRKPHAGDRHSSSVAQKFLLLEPKFRITSELNGSAETEIEDVDVSIGFNIPIVLAEFIQKTGRNTAWLRWMTQACRTGQTLQLPWPISDSRNVDLRDKLYGMKMPSCWISAPK